MSDILYKIVVFGGLGTSYLLDAIGIILLITGAICKDQGEKRRTLGIAMFALLMAAVIGILPWPNPR